MTLELRSPAYEKLPVHIPEEASFLRKSFNGTVCSSKGDEYRIHGNIIDFYEAQEKTGQTPAQRSNHLSVTAMAYEQYWRKQSISLISGEDFDLEREKELLLRWLDPQPAKRYLDVGCSTGLYARTIQAKEPKADTVALDFSNAMLKEARKLGRRENLNMYLLRADAKQMPAFGGTFDGVVSGGTLNELDDPLKVLYETARVIKKGGVCFIMHLLKSKSLMGKLLQQTTRLGGIKYWTLDESNALFERAGFTIMQQKQHGIVCFSRLVKK